MTFGEALILVRGLPACTDGSYVLKSDVVKARGYNLSAAARRAMSGDPEIQPLGPTPTLRSVLDILGHVDTSGWVGSDMTDAEQQDLAITVDTCLAGLRAGMPSQVTAELLPPEYIPPTIKTADMRHLAAILFYPGRLDALLTSGALLRSEGQGLAMVMPSAHQELLSALQEAILSRRSANRTWTPTGRQLATLAAAFQLPQSPDFLQRVYAADTEERNKPRSGGGGSGSGQAAATASPQQRREDPR